jgi:hypothetical protein
MDQIVHCKNRKNQRRISVEVCKYHVESKDRACMKRIEGKLVCETARKIEEEQDARKMV